MSKFTCGADINFKEHMMVVTDCMGLYDTVEDAVRFNKTLHHSFGCAIYEVDEKAILTGVTITSGMRMGRKTSGHPVIRFVGHAYNLPGWNLANPVDCQNSR